MTRYIFDIFYWKIVAGQCCGVSFCCTAKWIVYACTYIPSFLDFFPIYVTTGTEESSLCSTQVLSSSLLYTQQCTHGSLHLPAWCPYIYSLCLRLWFCFTNRFVCATFLNSTRMCSYAAFVFLLLIYFTLYDTPHVHPRLSKRHSFAPFHGWGVFHGI